MPVEWKTNPTAWLSTIDINKVMKQYEKNSDFVFLGAVPIDFDYDFGIGTCVSNELCNLDVENMVKEMVDYDLRKCKIDKLIKEKNFR